MPKLYHSRQHSIFSAQTIPLEKAKQYCLYDPKLLKYHWRLRPILLQSLLAAMSRTSREVHSTALLTS